METCFPNIEAAHRGLTREQVATELHGLIREAEQMLRATAQVESARKRRQSLEAALERARAICAQLQKEGWRPLRAAASKTDAAIREHPYAALGVAFALGVLIGVLATRR